MKPSQLVISSQPSWVVRSDTVELAVTKRGGHMAPVTFCRDTKKPVQPYYISPWQNEKVEVSPAVLGPLRGDFFCLPFGSNAEPFRGEKHPPHGETAGAQWELDECVRRSSGVTLALRLATAVRPGVVRREFTLHDGHNAVYCRTVISGFRGRTPFAHHAVLPLPEKERALRIFTSSFRLGRTYPVALGNPAAGEYQSLAVNKPFRSLAAIPTMFRGESPADFSSFPSRPGFCDLFQQFESTTAERLSWVAAINTENHSMWFSLKSPAIMPGRLFWCEQQGRHSAPWNGRNRCIGIEDGCMYFDRGIAESSRPNPISQRGIPTSVLLDGRQPYEVRYIQGAVNVPARFTSVSRVEFPPGAVIFHSHAGQEIRFDLHHEFLRGTGEGAGFP